MHNLRIRRLGACVIGLIFIFILFPCFVGAAPGIIQISNPFIKIVATQSGDEQGRFAIETTGGDPATASDDSQALIYGRPRPWTSYTTVLVDEIPYIFGGNTRRRAGRSGNYGTSNSPQINNNAIVTTGKLGPISVTQHLSFFRNPGTRVQDTVRITYQLTNTDKVAHGVGTRIMLDTMLGSNDGAPLRNGMQSITKPTKLIGADIADYWQAFDFLDNPALIAQGTVSIPDSGINRPDKIILADWGTLADYPWDPLLTTSTFIRSGESDPDTALALVWLPRKLLPGQTIEVSTLYGLGSLSRTKGNLTLGLTAPSEVFSSSQQPILAVGYITNSGSYTAANAIAKWRVPVGFRLDLPTSNQVLGTILPGQSRQLAVQLIPLSPQKGPTRLGLTVESDTLEPETIARTIWVVAPAELAAEFDVRPSGNFSIGTVTIKNNEPSELTNLNIRASVAEPAELTWFEPDRKTIESLLPDQSETITWVFNSPVEPQKIRLEISSDQAPPKSFIRFTPVVTATDNIALNHVPVSPKKGQYLAVDIRALRAGSGSIQWDSSKVKFLAWQPAQWVRLRPDVLVQAGPSMCRFGVPDGVDFPSFFGILYFKVLTTEKIDFSIHAADGQLRGYYNIRSGEQ